MKPYETKTLLTKDFQTVKELQDLLERAIQLTTQHPSSIYVTTANLDDSNERIDARFALEAECLSDGSLVYNITLY